MTFPASITSTWISTRKFPTCDYEAALSLHDEEKYADSNLLLDELFSKTVWATSKLVPAVRILVLYAWNLHFQREFDKLESLFDQLDFGSADEFSEFIEVRLRFLIQTGRCEEALEFADCFQQENVAPISPALAGVLYAKSLALYKLGRVDECLKYLEICYSLYSLQNDNRGAALAGNYLGGVYSRISDYRESIKWLHRSLPYYEDDNRIHGESMVNLNIGITYYKVGDYTSSFKHLRKSHELGTQGDWSHRQCFANIALGNVYRLTRDNESARQHLHTAYNQAQELQFPREEALALEFLGDVYRDEGAPREARRFYTRAMAIGLRIAPEGDIVMEIHRRNGECLNLEGNQGEALASLNKALKMARAQGDRYEEAVTLRVMCETATNTGDLKSARKYINESVTILKDIDARHELAISLLSSATLKIQEAEDPRAITPRIVHLNEAWTEATMSLDLFIKVDVRWWTEQSRALVSRVSAMRNAQDKADKTMMASGNSSVTAGYNPGNVVIHQSRVMRDVLQLCDMFAATDEPVLITGETGTGKEIIGKRLHQHSGRADKPLVIVNVAAIPETMFEREFFGHVKGAFSGAVNNGEGYAARANNGTLFLDEIGDMPLELQPKLLRLLEESTYQALGDPKQRRTNIRLVAATNANLEQKVQAGTFRADLYYRLRSLDLPLPAVRDRCEDVLPLMRHFLCVAAKKPVDLIEYFSHQSQSTMEAYDWPGNVREIALVARQAHVSLQAFGRVDVKIKRHDQTSLRLASQELAEMAEAAGKDEPAKAVPVLSQSEIVERSRILLALDEAGSNRNNAAKALGIGRSTLYRKMEKYGIPNRRS